MAFPWVTTRSNATLRAANRMFPPTCVLFAAKEPAAPIRSPSTLTVCAERSVLPQNRSPDTDWCCSWVASENTVPAESAAKATCAVAASLEEEEECVPASASANAAAEPSSPAAHSAANSKHAKQANRNEMPRAIVPLPPVPLSHENGPRGTIGVRVTRRQPAPSQADDPRPCRGTRTLSSAGPLRTEHQQTQQVCAYPLCEHAFTADGSRLRRAE